MVALLDTKPPSADEFDRLRAMIDEAHRQPTAGPRARRARARGRPTDPGRRPAGRPSGPGAIPMPDSSIDSAEALLDATLAATAIAGFVVLAMVQCRQPARREGGPGRACSRPCPCSPSPR